MHIRCRALSSRAVALQMPCGPAGLAACVPLQARLQRRRRAASAACEAPTPRTGTMLSAKHAAERFDACWHGGVATIEALREQGDALLREYLASGDLGCGGEGPRCATCLRRCPAWPGACAHAAQPGAGRWRCSASISFRPPVAWPGPPAALRDELPLQSRSPAQRHLTTAVPARLTSPLHAAAACREAERCLRNLNVPHFHHDFVSR